MGLKVILNWVGLAGLVLPLQKGLEVKADGCAGLD